MGKAKFSEKVSYGIGAMTYCLELTVMLSYLLIFCSDVMMIDITIVGIVVSVTKIIDAISDIVITNIADKLNFKSGKYKVWYLMGIPLAIFMCLNFMYPSFLVTENSKIFWVCIIYIITVPIFETAVTGPIMALNITVSENMQDRLDFSLARAIGEAVANIIASMLCMTIVLSVSSFKDVAGWRVMALVIGALMIICCLIGFFGTKERVHISNENQQGEQLTLKEKFALLRGNKPFWKLVLVIVMFMFHYYYSMAVFTYFCIYDLGNPAWVSPLLSLGMAAQVITTVALIFVGRKVEKRMLMVSGGISILLSCVVLFFAHGFAVAVIYEVFLGVGNGIFNSIAFASLADVSDYTEWKTGIAIPGLISAFATFMMKIGGALATLLASQLLVWANYDAVLEVQSQETQFFIRCGFAGFSFICILIATGTAYSLKELKKEKITAYRMEINEKVKMQNLGHVMEGVME